MACEFYYQPVSGFATVDARTPFISIPWLAWSCVLHFKPSTDRFQGLVKRRLQGIWLESALLAFHIIAARPKRRTLAWAKESGPTFFWFMSLVSTAQHGRVLVSQGRGKHGPPGPRTTLVHPKELLMNPGTGPIGFG